MIWINQNLKETKESERPVIREREIYLKELLPLVDFSRLTRFFLISIVSTVIEEIENQEIKEYANEKYVTSLESRLETNVQSPESHIQRVYSDMKDKFAMKVEYRRISEWKEGPKYYSQPVFFHGFLFYYFMRVEREKPKDTTAVVPPPFLAGYLRCTCDATIKTNDHYLPVSLTYEIALKNGKTRKYPPVSVVFDHYEKSIGSKINPPKDTWEKIRSGQSDIVIDDKIITLIAVELTN